MEAEMGHEVDMEEGNQRQVQKEEELMKNHWTRI